MVALIQQPATTTVVVSHKVPVARGEEFGVSCLCGRERVSGRLVFRTACSDDLNFASIKRRVTTVCVDRQESGRDLFFYETEIAEPTPFSKEGVVSVTGRYVVR